MEREIIINVLDEIKEKNKKKDMIVLTSNGDRKFKCPSCGMYFKKEDIIKYTYRYCYNCGQSVDFVLPENKTKSNLALKTMNEMDAFSDDILFKRLSEIEDDMMDMHISAHRCELLDKEKTKIVTELRIRGYQK